MKISFLIILYNKQTDQSLTINSLKSIDNDYRCMVINNGPSVLTNLDLFEDSRFELIEYLDNKPLSFLYNKFICQFLDKKFDRFILLDDDSVLTESFIQRVFTKEFYDLELPKIYDASSTLFYPLKNWQPVSFNEKYLDIDKDTIFSIGSGLVLSDKLVNIFKKRKISLFNENFAFYGVDFSFFWELKKNNINNIIITSKSEIIHDMSLHGKVSKNKLNELYINFALQMRHYPNYVNFKNFIYNLLGSVKNREFKMFSNMLNAYFTGTHPRCRGQ